MQNRIKSWALWVSIGALIVFVAKQLFGLDIGEFMNGLIDVLFPVVVGLGIINNPEAPDHF